MTSVEQSTKTISVKLYPNPSLHNKQAIYTINNAKLENLTVWNKTKE